MTRAKISQYSATANDNTDVNGVDIAEGCPPSSMNNMGREIMAALKRFQVGSDGDGVTVGGSLVVSGSTTLANTATLSNVTSATLAAGSASSPTLHAGGDTNTGVYFPAADQVAVAAGGSVAAAFNSHQFMGMRNRIINGDMRIDQRNAGAAIATGQGFAVDRWQADSTQASKLNIQQNNGSVTPPAGFTNYWGANVATAYTITATDTFYFRQMIEGLNVSDLGWGTANAKTVTLSFWVRSSLTGTFGGAIKNSANNRSYPFTYSISASNTWEQKSVTIAGDTSGTWLTTNGTGIRVVFNQGVGSNLLGTAGAWAGANYDGATGQVQLVETLNATWYVTGVQFEVGSVATPFERRPYGTELALCQRYFQKSYDDSVAPGSNVSSTLRGIVVSGTVDSGGSQYTWVSTSLLVTMRSSPTISYWDVVGNATKYSTYNGTTNGRTDNVGAFGTVVASNSVLSVNQAIPANTAAAFAFVASSEL